jgi:MOSC domain-containing protein YiiM
VPHVLSVNVAVVSTGAWTGRLGRTGIDKRPVTGPVGLTWDGVAGDTVCDRKFHGGSDRAVYAFSADEYAHWAGAVGRELTPGSFGENVTIGGLDINACRLGERWAIGSAELEISAPRIACRVFAGFWDIPDLVRQFTEHGQPGAYLRVVGEGQIEAGKRVKVLSRPRGQLTVGEAFRALTTEPDLLPRLARAVEYLPTDLRVRSERRLARRTSRV